MPTDYFCVGSTLDEMVNIETVVLTPPNVLPSAGGMPMRLQGGVAERAGSGRQRRNGAQLGTWMFDAPESMNEWRSLQTLLFGNATVSGIQRYIITLDSEGQWSPFLVYLDCPYLGESMSQSNYLPHKIAVQQFGGVLQSVTKSASYTVTTSDHLVVVSGGLASLTMTLPALSLVPFDVPFRFVNSAVHSLVLDGNASETIDGATTLVLAAQTLLTDGFMEMTTTASWTAGNSATLSKQTGTPYAGARVLRVARNGNDFGYAFQNVFTPGKLYTVSGVMRSDANAIPSVWGNGVPLATGTTSTSWQAFSFTFSAVSAALFLLSTATVNGQYSEFDEVTVTTPTTLPESATLIHSGSEWVRIA